MPTLSLGVQDVPYQGPPIPGERPRRPGRVALAKPPASPRTTTTYDVARYLENRYSLFSLFSVFRGKDFTDALEEAVAGKLETLLMGGPASSDALLGEGELAAIESAFRGFLDNREMDGRAPGVPTAASLRGVNHRLMRPYAKSNPARPSFIDMGILQAHFRAWMD